NIIPVINENDTVAIEEIRFGDNDTLAALVTNLIEADVLIILTDQAGLFTSDPRKNQQAKLIEEVAAGDPSIEKMAGGIGSSIGRGGMLSKVIAAKRAARSGAHTIIASGHEKDVLIRLANGESIGTRLLAKIPVLAARKQWLADYLQVRGHVVVDHGAASALIDDGKSLLPIGVTSVSGDFERGEAVACLNPEGKEIARGLINYSAVETRKIMRKASREIDTILGYVDESELIHRNNLVLL
ncbi:MAG: glutamate 5-kinase, partial [Nitrosomonas sp.]|nr:glutamate 5-kinase [Nitrosomonas sp.]